MKTQILPNWFKKVGLIIFIVGSIIGGGDDFMRGWNSVDCNCETLEKTSQDNKGLITVFVGGEGTTHIFYVLSFIGMLIYMLAKEKVEDDYINKLRLESFQITSIITLIIAILLFAFSNSKYPNIQLDLFLALFFWFYLITFFIKKRIDL